MSILRNLSDRDFQPQPASADAGSSIVNLDGRRGKPAWEREVVGALCKYISLPQGWDSYNGKPLRYDTGMFALQLLSSIMNETVPLPSLVPVACGGVQVEWHQNGLDIELYIAAPYDSELSIYDHSTQGPQQVIRIAGDFGPVIEHVRRLTDFNRHHVHAA